MATLKLCDRYSSTLASGYTSGGGTLEVTSAGSGDSALPSAGDFYLVVEAEGANTEEVFKVTARSSTTLTVTGAQAGTSASNHASGAVIRGVLITTAALNQFRQDIHQTGLDASKSAEKAGNLYLPSNGIYLRRDTGSAWANWGPAFPLTEPVLADFSWVNQGGATAVNTYGGIYLSAPAGATDNYRMLVKTAPATPYVITMGAIFNIAHANYSQAGMLFRQSSDGKIASLILMHDTATDTDYALNSSKMTNATTFSANYTSVTYGFPNGLFFLRISDDGANRLTYFSTDGISFHLIHSVTRTDFLTADQIGFFANSVHASLLAHLHVIHWKQE